MDREQLIAELKKFKKKLEKKYKIEKMILFGSRLKKTKPKKDSDVDLIVVGEFKEKTNLKRAPKLHLQWNINLPVDFLCYTPEEFNNLSKKTTIIKDALKKGIIIDW